MADGLWRKLAQKLRSVVGRDAPRGAGQPDQPTLMNLEIRLDLTEDSKPNLGLPPDAIPGLTVIKELVRGLRYLTVDQLVGLKIEVSSSSSAAAEVRAAITAHGIDLGELVEDSGVMTFLKYGLLDYTFGVVKTDLVATPQRARFLKEIGLLPDKADVSDSIFPDGGIGFLEEMLGEVRANRLLLKILLDRDETDGVVSRVYSKDWMHADAAPYFPCVFTVRDACLTNCSLIWLCKHFYL
ncbi:MAG: hypothetical protein JSS86_05465 [Cyanobacteria bacterium SZAS LIN-2]|nr:hypothetical protein [Cyanobacteria bacterium SZAS LIN-3]MBS1995735.1 hypothetical protein [Cyanobacteria bacterium SZAS LIN-2]